MSDTIDLFVKIYIDWKTDKPSLIQYLLDVMGGVQTSASFVSNNWCMAGVAYEKLKCRTSDVSNDTRWLNFPFTIEIEPIPSRPVESKEYVQGIIDLVTRIGNDKIAAVATCDFEEEFQNRVPPEAWN